MSQQDKTGQCLCGAVKYEGLGERGRVHICHCPDCVGWTGGPLMGLQFANGVAVSDPAAVNWYKSSAWAERGSCKTCGSALFWRLRSDHNIVVVSAGSLDGKDALEPLEEHIFIDKKPPWYEFADDAPRLTGAEFMARLQAGTVTR